MSLKLIDKMKFRLLPLLLFSFGEVLLFRAEFKVQVIVTVIEYLFITVALLRDLRVGLMYLISFSLLAMGGWSYVTQVSQSGTFWGLRLFDTSLNIIYTVAVCGALFFKAGFNWGALLKAHECKILVVYFLVCSVVGGLGLLFGEIYLDNLVGDLAIFVPYFLYVLIISKLGHEDLALIATYGLAVTVATMLASLIGGVAFDYGDGYQYVLMNGYSYVAFVAIVFMRRSFHPVVYYLLLTAMLYFTLAGKLFIGGKAIVIALAAITWSLLTSLRAYLVGGILLFLLVALSAMVTTYIEVANAEDSLVGYKFSQLVVFTKVSSLHELATEKTSVGNLAAEAATIIGFYMTEPFRLMVGKGLGGGVPDIYGFLTPAVGEGAGYSSIDAARNNFSRMHLPLFQFLIRGGIFGFVAFGLILTKFIVTKNGYGLVAGIILATVFTNSKEMALLFALFAALSRTQVRRSVNSNCQKPTRSGSINWRSNVMPEAPTLPAR